jgi:DNA-binding XRE family transcriptional regulator
VPKKPRPSLPGLEIRAGTGELFINGRRVQGNQTMLGLLARLFDNLGAVVPYEDLCLLIGHKSANSAATHVLRQYIGWLRGVLIANKAPYAITVAREVGYSLCRLAEEPRRISTSRSTTLPELGRNLRRVRTAAGLTQTALAKRSGVDRSYVSDLEAGHRNPTALTLKRLAKVLGVTPTAFFL